MSPTVSRSTSVATALNAVATITPQLVPLLLLTPIGYAQFSMVYLVFAAGTSTVFSVISDAWSRTWLGRRPRVGWRHYSAALMWVSLGFGAAGLGVGLLVGIGWYAALGALAVATLVFRTGSRYYESHVADWQRVVIGDLANVLTSGVLVVAGLILGWDALALSFLVWALGSVAAVAVSRVPQLERPSTVRRWWVTHRRAIKPLLADSLLLDTGAIGTPYVLAPILGLAPFGVYRAVANVGIPVQLMLNPLRPLVSQTPAARLLGPRLLVPFTVLLLLAGGAAYVIMLAIPTLPVRLGVLSDLYQVALPAALFVPGNGLRFYCDRVARGHAPANGILPARLAQTVRAVAAPLIGALGWGLSGAVWGFSASTLAFALVWWLALVLPAPYRVGADPRSNAPTRDVGP